MSLPGSRSGRARPGSGSLATPCGPKPEPGSCSGTTASVRATPRPTSATPRRPGRSSWTGWRSTPPQGSRNPSCRPLRVDAAGSHMSVPAETMALDIRSVVLIHRPRSDVAAFMFDPANDLRWTGGITASRPAQAGLLAPGATVGRTARFLGRTFDYGYLVTQHDPDRMVELKVDRPFPML